MSGEQPTVAEQIIGKLHEEAPSLARLDAFRQKVAEVVANGRRLTSAQRLVLLREQFPALAEMSASEAREAWLKAMGAGNRDEIVLLAAVLRDIHEHDQATPGRSGPKPAVHDVKRVHELFRQFAGEDHTTLPFREIFVILCDGRSHRAMAAKCGLDRNKVLRLLSGNGRGSKPTKRDMELIAAAFRKHPSFFLEYRVEYLRDELSQQLAELPEASIDLYRKRAGGH